MTERRPSSAEIKLGDIKVSREKRREQAITFIKKQIEAFDLDPCDLYDPDYIIQRARELEDR
jgi:hypothetical protein